MTDLNEIKAEQDPEGYIAQHGSIDIDVSDLFFNHDLTDAIERENGQIVGWNMEKLREEAETFLGSVERLAPGKAPTVDHLIADFFARM